ncbi:MAG: hypothetical protein ACTS6G_00295 [Candidatus Hodgkinia cicadicola]
MQGTKQLLGSDITFGGSLISDVNKCPALTNVIPKPCRTPSAVVVMLIRWKPVIEWWNLPSFVHRLSA